MKDRVREAVFNLVGPSVRGTHALDLFAGTGALALEALSRGARRATFIEQHLPTAAVLRENIEALSLQLHSDVVTADVFIWAKHLPDLGAAPWLVFSSPPYDFYVDRSDEMHDLLARLIDSAPPESIFVVESDTRFDLSRLPQPGAWKTRSYPPAVVAVYRTEVVDPVRGTEHEDRIDS
jgi:16S rRNA (guanine966-N2)-methyltransferase